MAEVENSSTASGEASTCSVGNQVATAEPPPKKKRNLPGMPDPNAEVVALSPKTLMATNRFVCEICSKGFQRDQNLQLHRRGHNLPWKLRQRTGTEVRKRVYVCPEPSCLHHSPSRALGDLTGIKKHFCRKHGEKKWKCDRCPKIYAVHSDWKAHMKTCGTREYRCECRTLFSRKDSYIMHKAYCDALAEESAKARTAAVASQGDDERGTKLQSAVASSPPPTPAPTPLSPVPKASSPVLSIHSGPELPENPASQSPLQPSSATSNSGSSSSTSSSTVFASVFAPPTTETMVVSPPSRCEEEPPSSTDLANIICNPLPNFPAPERVSLCLNSTPLGFSHNAFAPSLFPSPADKQSSNRPHYVVPSQPAMSATALLQKAAQMGAAASKGSLLHGLGLAISSSSSDLQERYPAAGVSYAAPRMDGLGLGVGGRVMGPPATAAAQLERKPMTLDFLGLGGGGGSAPSGGLPTSLLASMGESGGLGEGDPGFWGDGLEDRKPSRPGFI